MLWFHDLLFQDPFLDERRSDDMLVAERWDYSAFGTYCTIYPLNVHFVLLCAQSLWCIVLKGLQFIVTNVDVSSVRPSDIHLRAISWEISQPSITKLAWKLLDLKFHPNHPGGQWIKLALIPRLIWLQPPGHPDGGECGPGSHPGKGTSHPTTRGGHRILWLLI